MLDVRSCMKMGGKRTHTVRLSSTTRGICLLSNGYSSDRHTATSRAMVLSNSLPVKMNLNTSAKCCTANSKAQMADLAVQCI